jgi:hypothetical protein
VRHKVKWSDCERMSEMITMAYLDDLRYFQLTGASEIGETGDEIEHLIALGFYRREMSRFGRTVVPHAQPILSTYGEHPLHAFANSCRGRQPLGCP